MKLKALVGSGHKIARLALPVLAVGLTLNIVLPSWFSVGGPSVVLKWVSVAALVPGVAIWAWSALLILTSVPRGKLVTYGSYRWVKHPLYTSVALLVVPAAGFLFNTWLGALVGIAIYLGSKLYSPEEERALSGAFGPVWEGYCRKVRIPWL